MGKIIAVCASEKKGTQKRNVGSAVFRTQWGIENDAHAGDWHRQVSLLSREKIDAFRARGAEVADGAFGENLVVEGFDFARLPVGIKFCCGDVVLEMTQIGKKCHHGCTIFEQMGECIMPREGVFARVLHGGVITVGDELTILEEESSFRVAVITLSDSGYRGEREDESGRVIRELVTAAGYTVVQYDLLPDDRDILTEKLVFLCDSNEADLILTTGGTGFSPRDNTPEATADAVERPAFGIAEAIRLHSLQITPNAMLSRGTAGIRKQTLIVNLPGSPKAVRECLAYLLPPLRHGLEVLKGRTKDCAKDNK